VAQAVVRKNKVKTDVDFAAIREGFSQRLVGWSNADVEAVVLLANDSAAREAGPEATTCRHLSAGATVSTPLRECQESRAGWLLHPRGGRS
jgi:hypothetical protein